MPHPSIDYVNAYSDYISLAENVILCSWTESLQYLNMNGEISQMLVKDLTGIFLCFIQTSTKLSAQNFFVMVFVMVHLLVLVIKSHKYISCLLASEYTALHVSSEWVYPENHWQATHWNGIIDRKPDLWTWELQKAVFGMYM